MSKVFTITEGLENMGAIRTGGQGSVYKGRRTGEIISAIKLLPTPIHSEDKKDKNYRDFINEVEKLKKVNEIPNPNVVKILSSGLSESGSFPFIEMEYIDGPDLQELLEAPNDPIFSIHELIKLATQLSNALAHCHRVGVKHGDIKSNNVKFNAHTGNYVLLDFGLAIMSDEQRRTSLRHAGAIEFMAPEQNEGQMLFQSDVYSFGVILYELLAGRVPFPLNDKGETARNKVMISHMEEPVPDVLSLRRQRLPKDWSQERKDSEMKVPAWILEIIDKCLEKEPSSRFTDGVELHESIIRYYTAEIGNSEATARRNSLLEKENQELTSKLLLLENREIITDTNQSYANPGKINISRPLFYGMLLSMVGLVALAGYLYYSRKPNIDDQQIVTSADTTSADSSTRIIERRRREDDNFDKKIRSLIDSVQRSDDANQNKEINSNDTVPEEDLPVIEDPEPSQSADPATVPIENENNPPPKAAKYTLSATRAYFYGEPNENSRKNNFLAKWNSAELTALDDKNGFIYVEFFTINGQITKGWLRKRDLRRIGA